MVPATVSTVESELDLLRSFSGTDDLHFLPNGNILSTFMGSKVTSLYEFFIIFVGAVSCRAFKCGQHREDAFIL